MVWFGTARLGKAGQGAARRGKARQGEEHGKAWRGLVGMLKGGGLMDNPMDRFAKVNEIIAEVLHMDEGDIESQMSLVDDLGADELDVMEILMALRTNTMPYDSDLAA